MRRIAILMVAFVLATVRCLADQQPAPASIYAALQAQRNTCQDQAALAAATSGEELAKVKAELASLKKDFGVQE